MSDKDFNNFLNFKTLAIIQFVIIGSLIFALCLIATKKTKKIETVKVVKSVPIVSEYFPCKKGNTENKNILFLGNSITMHPIVSIWWGKWGMAASKRENDYVHVLSKKLSEKYNTYSTIVLFRDWEFMSHDRAETFDLLEPALTKKYDYIVVQLGENVDNKSSIKKDYDELIGFLKEKYPLAEIFVVGEYWKGKYIDTAKKETCKKFNVNYIDLKEMQTGLYDIKLNALVGGDDGEMHKIESTGVAKHPGDAGMEYIADKIYSSLIGQESK